MPTTVELLDVEAETKQELPYDQFEASIEQGHLIRVTSEFNIED